MKGVLIAFTVPTGKDRTRASAFAKAFYGQETSSHHGKYRYRRRGLMDEISYNKLIRGVIIIRTDDVGRVTEFLEQHSAEYHVRVVELTERDREVMELSVE
ncbi:MAG: hypothetical protein GQ567_00225 [Methanosarcinales archaeon]|nr:hypothetical protein [Methanosarcinales archaeon]